MEPVNLATLIESLPRGGRPLATKLYEALRRAIQTRHLPDTAVLPSTRQAAQQLGLGRNTVIAAYELLASEGMITLAPRQLPRIVPQHAETAPVGPPARGEAMLSRRGQALAQPRPNQKGVLHPSQPDPALFPYDLWGRALRRAARMSQGPAALYDAFQGLPKLRAALADQLLRHQGLAASPDQILITPSTQASMALVARLLADPGDTVLVEDPGYRGARLAFAGAGLQIEPLPIGPEGALFHSAPAAKLAYVTPSVHYPSGVRLSLAGRHAALAWARRHNATLISDEFGSEFLWRGQKLPSFGALDEAAQVVTLGAVAGAAAGLDGGAGRADRERGAGTPKYGPRCQYRYSGGLGRYADRW